MGFRNLILSKLQRKLGFVAGCLIAVALLAWFIGATMVTFGVHSPITDPDDFRAFYCAGNVLVHGADPYRTEPLRACEHGAAATFGLVMPAGIVDPSPLPPYAAAFFGIFGAFPFAVASTMWFAVSLVALAAGVVTTVKLSGARPIWVALAFTTAGALVSINEGQIAPVVTAALGIAALAAREGRMRSVAIAFGFALLEPHVALPGALAVLAEKRARAPLAVLAVALLAIDLIAGGPMRTIEYVTRVLPAHALTEIESLRQQFSLTTLLWEFGFRAGIAKSIGTLDFIAMAALGIVVAVALERRFDDRAFYVLVPPAFVLLGGEFIHLFQMVVALPLAFLCYGTMRRSRPLVIVAIIGLAIPVQYIVGSSGLRDTLYGTQVVDSHVASAWSAGPAELAESTEMAMNGAGRIVRPDPRSLWLATLPKTPTWLALVLLVFVCVREAWPNAKRPRPITPV